MKKYGAHKGLHIFSGERGIRTLGPVTVSGFRDRPNRPLWHLSEVRTMYKKNIPLSIPLTKTL